MGKFFVIIDMQKDFVDGSLANPAAAAIIPAIKEAAEKALADGAELIFTLDTHYKDYLKTGEGKHLPVEHCIEGTDGWKIVDELQDLATNAIMIPKEHFGSNLWTEYIPNFEEVQTNLLPRMAATAEVGWTIGERNFDDFARRIHHLRKLYDKNGIIYAPYFFNGTDEK
jgi:hypothetical protein